MLVQTPWLADALKADIAPDRDRLLRLMLSLRQLKPKALFAQLDDPNVYAGFAAPLTGVPRVVLSFRNRNPSCFPPPHQSWYRRAYGLLARSARVRLTGNSEAANRDYEQWLGLTLGRTYYIPNAASPAHFPTPRREAVAEWRRRLGVQPSQRIVLGVFRLSLEKNPQAFLRVFAQVAHTRPDLCGLVAGVGPLEQPWLRRSSIWTLRDGSGSWAAGATSTS